jgi:hypothetical protein
VFPKLDRSQIATASADRVPEVAQLTLLTLIGEEFGFEVDLEEFDEATSFVAIAERLRQRAAGA